MQLFHFWGPLFTCRRANLVFLRNPATTRNYHSSALMIFIQPTMSLFIDGDNRIPSNKGLANDLSIVIAILKPFPPAQYIIAVHL